MSGAAGPRGWGSRHPHLAAPCPGAVGRTQKWLAEPRPCPPARPERVRHTPTGRGPGPSRPRSPPCRCRGESCRTPWPGVLRCSLTALTSSLRSTWKSHPQGSGGPVGSGSPRTRSALSRQRLEVRRGEHPTWRCSASGGQEETGERPRAGSSGPCLLRLPRGSPRAQSPERGRAPGEAGRPGK